MEGATAQRVVARARDRRLAVGVACAAAIALVAWPIRTLEPGVGGDWNWVLALDYAAEHGLRFGKQVVFSYGPLGFLNTTYGPALYYGDVLLLSWLFRALVQLLLAGTLLIALRRSLPPGVAVVVAAVVLTLAPERALVLGFGWCALIVTRDEDAPRDRIAAALPVALGVLAGVLLLGKLNQGIELAMLAVLALVAVPSRRDALAFAGAFLATAVVGWLASGQVLGDVWPFLRYGAEVVLGYGEAMGGVFWKHPWTSVLAIALALAAVLLSWYAMREAPPRRRRALVALCAVYVAFNFKEGFVREDPVHLTLFFGDMLALFAFLPLPPSRRLLQVATVAAAIVAVGTVGGVDYLGRRVNAYANVKAAADQVRTVASPTRQAQIASDLRARIAAAYETTPQLAEAVGRRSVMMWPALYSEIAYAYDLDLRPLPTLEPYSTYTPALDRLGARMLASAQAPARILRGLTAGLAIDGRHPTFEAPLATLEILCRYRVIGEQGAWQVLARTRDRCGAPRTLHTVRAAWGAQVAVPAPRRPDALLLVRVHGADPQGLERIKALLLRPDERWIALDGERFRLVVATAADGLLLHAPAEADYPGPSAMAPNPLVISVGRHGGQPSGRLSYTFVEAPIRPFPPAARSP